MKRDRERIEKMQLLSAIPASPVQIQSTITCPHCHVAKLEEMPTDACQFFYRCTNCGVLLRPLGEDCCVFCSYGDVPCPPKQQEDCSC
jgi:hypothetical protein